MPLREPGPLTGRRVLVTGASSGIGEATCRAIVERGGSVAMLARRKERIDALAEELGERAIGAPADVTDLEQLERAIDRAADVLGGLDGVIAVAGQNIMGTIHTGTPQRWREVMDVNLIGPLATARYAIQHFPTAGRRDIVFVGSSACLSAMTSLGIYSASKRGLRAASESMRLELAPAGINVSHVIPGLFETEGITADRLPIDGEMAPRDVTVFAPGTGPGPVSTVVDAIILVIGLPEGAGVDEIVVRPTGHLRP